MPARDPAASPSNLYVGSSTNAPVVGSPSSSGYSFAGLVSPTNDTGTPNVPIQSQQNYGAVPKAARRKLSVDKSWQNQSVTNGNANGSGISNGLGLGHTDERRGSGVVPRRKPSMEWTDAPPSASESNFSASSTSSYAIRDSSNRLASLSLTSSRPRRISSSSHQPPDLPHLTQSPEQHRLSVDNTRGYRPTTSSNLKVASVPKPSSTSPDFPGSVKHVGPSGLSVMLERDEERKRQSAIDLAQVASESPDEEDIEDTPVPRHARLSSMGHQSEVAESERTVVKQDFIDNSDRGTDGDEDDHHASSALRRFLSDGGDIEHAGEGTPLLGRQGAATKGLGATLGDWKRRAGKLTGRDVVQGVIVEPVTLLPATILGLLLNVLDGVSYGMILFPASPVFQDFGSLGVSMFFVSCIVSQLIFSLGGSIFPGGNGSMMIEAVPFFHILVNIIQSEIGDDDQAIISTTMVAFAFSSILTGLVFFTLGAFKLGSLIGYFPRHILVGCIGGVGIFLIETGLEVSFGLKEEGFEYNLTTLKRFFDSIHAIALWAIPLALAIFLRVVTHFYHHQLIFPAYFFLIPCIFYIVIAIGGWDLEYLRHAGWIFDVGAEAKPWYQFYTHFNFAKTNWRAFWAAMPTQLALVFFGILHVPLNVPALGVSLGEDNVKLDRELVAHGFTNLASGLVGSVPNYLCYVNTVLFYRVGGGSRLSGLMLAAATTAVLMIGPKVISFLPVMVVGALIFVLGLDLTVEAVWDTRHRVNRSEYITIWAIAIGMTVWDFVIGLLFGIILACIFFVVQSSRRRAIRTVFNGSTAKSTVRRPKSQRAFIQSVGTQTYVMKLQGFLFFGTISAVEAEIRKLLDMATWSHDPIRFLIIDLHLVHGLDFSSAEAFVRVQRILAAKDVLLILCGAKDGGVLESALRAVDLWPGVGEEGRLEVFVGLNEALEWTENAYLTAFYENQQNQQTQTIESPAVKTIDFPKVSKPPFTLAESFANSPRRSHLAKAGGDTLPNAYQAPASPSPSADTDYNAQPLPLLLQTLGPYLANMTSTLSLPSLSDESYDFLSDLAPFFTRIEVSSNTVLWRQSDSPDGLYLIEHGSLRATYSYDNHTREVQETMVAGTIAGDLSTLSNTARNATTVAERDCVLWRMDLEALERLEKEHPATARRFTRIVLKVVAEEHDVLNSHLIAVLS